MAEALVAMECRVTQIIRLGAAPPHSSHVLGEVLHWHIDDRILDESQRTPIDAAALDAVGRMGGVEYAYTRDRFAIDRPVIAPEDLRSIASAKARLGPDYNQYPPWCPPPRTRKPPWPKGHGGSTSYKCRT